MAYRNGWSYILWKERKGQNEMMKQEQTNNKVVKIYKNKRNSLSFFLNNKMLSQSLMLLLRELKNFGPWKRLRWNYLEYQTCIFEIIAVYRYM